MRDFYLTLPSNTKPVTDERHNLTSDFRVHLPNEIRLDGEWDVALVELQYPYSWNNLDDSYTLMGIRNNELAILTEQNRYDVVLPITRYTSVDQLLAAIEDSHTQTLKRLHSYSYGIYPDKPPVGFSYNPILGRVVCQADNGITVMISPLLRYLMGFDEESVSSSSHTALFPPDMRGGVDSLYVYCDLVEPQLLGDIKAPLLRVIPVTGISGEIIDRVFVAPHYIAVLNKKFSTVHISIKSDQNRPIRFEFGKAIVKLHFRQRRAILQ